MHRKYPLFFMNLLLISGLARGDGTQSPTGQAQAPIVEIAQQPAGRHLISLPALDFPLRIDAACGDDAVAESLSINIADTVNRYGASELIADLIDDTTIETTIRVPRSQIAPISIEGFCTEVDAGTAQTLVVPAALTANISLRCTIEETQIVRYVTQPLAIMLVCKSVNDKRSNTEPDQDSSAPAKRF